MSVFGFVSQLNLMGKKQTNKQMCNMNRGRSNEWRNFAFAFYFILKFFTVNDDHQWSMINKIFQCFVLKLLLIMKGKSSCEKKWAWHLHTPNFTRRKKIWNFEILKFWNSSAKIPLYFFYRFFASLLCNCFSNFKK